MIERHIEKIVLAVCVLILVWAIGHWALGSPREVEIIAGSRGRTEAVGPERVDEQLSAAANAIDDSFEDVRPEPYQLPNYEERFDRLAADPLEANMLVYLGRGGFPREPEDVDATPEGLGIVDLVALTPSPAKPYVNTALVYPQRLDAPPADVRVAHVLSFYPVLELRRAWQEALSTVRIEPVLAVQDVEAQVRRRLPDGSWSQPSTIQGVRVLEQGVIFDPPEVPEYTGENAEDIVAAFDELSQPSQQQALLQPEFYNVWSPPLDNWIDWRVHMPANPVSQSFEQAAEEEPAINRPTRRTPSPRRTERRLPQRPPRGWDTDEYEEDYEMPRRRPAGETMEMPDEAMEPAELPQPRRLPPFEQQWDNGRLAFWVHDIGIDPYETYQYRVRLEVVNPLITFDRAVRDPNVDSRIPTLDTPWSEWSQPQSVPQATEFFITGHIAAQNMVYVDVFARSLGQWVRRRFRVSPGERIGGVVEVDVPDPTTGELLRQEVDFSTGATVVDFDFNRTVVRNQIERQTVEAVYLDQAGRLHTRVQAYDEESERYAELRRQVERRR